MRRRAASLSLVIAATLTLTGCFVASTHIPKGTGPVADRRLVGSWQGIDDGDHNPTSDDVVLTFQMTTSTKPLRLTWNEGKKRRFYNVYTQKFGIHMGFAAKLTGPAEAQREDETKGAHYLGYYEFTPSGEGLIFYLLDKKKLAGLIASGKLKGNAGKGEHAMAILNGPAREVGRFLTSAKGFAARSEGPAMLRRLPAR
jgi:hypothetical protein